MIKKSAGLSFIELILVIALIAIVAATASPFLSNFILRSSERDACDQVLSFLLTARGYAMSSRENSDWGVIITGGQAVLFKGSNYADRDPTFDQLFDPPGTLSMSNAEVVFSKDTGDVSAAPINITISNTLASNILSINNLGVVDVN